MIAVIIQGYVAISMVKNLDSAVMIRFIEQNGEQLIYKSGGGITAQSEMMKEYEELIQKVYVPIR